MSDPLRKAASEIVSSWRAAMSESHDRDFDWGRPSAREDLVDGIERGLRMAEIKGLKRAERVVMALAAEYLSVSPVWALRKIRAARKRLEKGKR